MGKFKILSALLVLMCVSLTLNAQQRKKFRIYNALLFQKTPDLTADGLHKINLIYEDGVISTNYYEKNTKAPNRRFIDLKKIDKQAASSRLNNSIPTVLDVEHWNLNDKNYKDSAVIQYVNLIKAYRKNDAKSMVSVFHYGAVSDDIYNASNVIYPCYYTHGDNVNNWLGMVQNSMKKIKNHKVKKPVYAFIWPQYNPDPSRDNLGYKFVDRKLWRTELETLYKLCDGIIIWSHHRDENGKEIVFDKNMPWYQETLAFIKAHNIK